MKKWFHINRNSNYYPDIPAFLIIIPVISAINYYLTYSNIQFNGFLALRFSIDTVQGYVAWLIVRAIILYLDRRWPLEGRELKRILVQVLITTFAGLFFIAASTEILSILVKGEWAPLHFYFFDLIIIGIWFFVLNGIYIGLYYHRQLKQSRTQLSAPEEALPSALHVRKGSKDIRLDFTEIIGFGTDSGYSVCFSADGSKFYFDQSLNELQDSLPSPQFFRLNRQYIISHQFIRGYNRAENGKVIALIKDNAPFPNEITISRTKAPGFKQWFQSA